MTKKIHVHLIDDLDASEASETMRFEVDGKTYEIDLSSHNAQKFRTEIAPYIAHARRVITHARRHGRAGTGSGPPRGPARTAPRGSVRPSGQAPDVTEAEVGVPGHGRGLPPRAEFGGARVDGHSARIDGYSAGADGHSAGADGHPAGRDFGDEGHPPS
jgi:hypothetical protein